MGPPGAGYTGPRPEAPLTSPAILAHLSRIARAPEDGSGWDVVIVCTTLRWAPFWRDRLEATRGHVVGREAKVAVVVEDWPGGAGNGLGTLHAFEQAMAGGLDLPGELRHGAAIALFHTAGKGTRLAPLPACEGNNKPAVKLPGLVRAGRHDEPITILEAVIRQTAIYGRSRRGRLSVFWGDQVFLPSAPAEHTPRHHADLLAALGPLPTAEEWTARGLHRYGLMAVGRHGEATQLEKVEHATVVDLVGTGRLDVSGGIGVSLGSFSVSAALLDALRAELAPELSARTGRLDSDPHFWMPLCWDRETYAALMGRKGTPEDVARAHHDRMRGVWDQLRDGAPELGLLGAVDVGTDGFWWDYGQLRTYVACCRKVLDRTGEGAAMRAFFGLPDPDDTGSIVVGGAIRRADLQRSVLVDVRAADVETVDAVLVDVRAPEVTARDALLYHVLDGGPVLVDGAVVRSDVETGQGRLTFTAPLDADGGADWHRTLPGNPMSWDDLHRLVDEAG